MKLSISEIISKRFKNKIKVYEATNPSEVEKMIIRPPEAVNDFESSQLTFLDNPKGVWTWSELFGAQFRNLTTDMAAYMRYKQQRLISLAKRIRESLPISFHPEASPTDLLTEVHKSKLLSDKPISLAQTKSKQLKNITKDIKKGGLKKSMTQFGDYNRRVQGGVTRNVILLIVIIAQVAACCVLGKVCAPPMAHETKLEHNSRKH